jgi:hypothetical protein
MASKRIQTEITFGGGWATDYGPNFSGGGERISVPFLVTADNIMYELDGGPHKIGGAAKLNTVSLGATTAVRGLYDFWRMGTTGTATQKRICHAGTKIYKEDLDGTWDELFTGMDATSVPSYTTFDDLLIISSNADEAPKSWDLTTAQSLAGTPPNFAFAVAHKKYVFASGNIAYPQRLYYCKQEDPEDWTDASAGSIDILSNDGDAITGLYGDHKSRLWVFKGTNKGSIWQVTGSSETDWAVVPFKRGVGCVAHNSIVPFGDDLAWMSNQGIHALSATDAYGDFKEAFLSAPIGRFFREEISESRLTSVWGVNYARRGMLVFTMSLAGQTENTVMLALDYRSQPFRWAKWTVPAAACLAIVNNSRRPELMAGTYTGHVLRMDQPNRDMAGTAYTGKVTLPYMNLGSSAVEKYAAKVFLGIATTGNYTFTFGYQRDGQTQQTATLAQSGADVLGTATANQFTLGTSTLGGSRFIAQPADMEGSFRDIQFEVSNGGLNQDLELHTIGFHAESAGISEVVR